MVASLTTTRSHEALGNAVCSGPFISLGRWIGRVLADAVPTQDPMYSRQQQAELGQMDLFGSQADQLIAH